MSFINTLITIGPSHYCEKVRWALRLAEIPFKEETHLPIFHVYAVKKAGGEQTTPTLICEDQTLGDSTAILHWIDEKKSVFRPYSDDSNVRNEILSWENKFDENLGPNTRRFAYFHLLEMPSLAKACLRHQVSQTQARVLPLVWPFMKIAMRKSMRIDADGACRSKKVIDELFDEVGVHMVGRDYLVGEMLSAADITFATLAAPVLLPRSYGAFMPPIGELPEMLQERINAYRLHPAGVFALRIYDELVARSA